MPICDPSFRLPHGPKAAILGELLSQGHHVGSGLVADLTIDGQPMTWRQAAALVHCDLATGLPLDSLETDLDYRLRHD